MFTTNKSSNKKALTWSLPCYMLFHSVVGIGVSPYLSQKIEKNPALPPLLTNMKSITINVYNSWGSTISKFSPVIFFEAPGNPLISIGWVRLFPQKKRQLALWLPNSNFFCKKRKIKKSKQKIVICIIVINMNILRC